MHQAIAQLAQLDYSDSTRPLDSLVIIIEDGSQFTFRKIRSYYRRNNIYNPFSHVASHSTNDNGSTTWGVDADRDLHKCLAYSRTYLPAGRTYHGVLCPEMDGPAHRLLEIHQLVPAHQTSA